jgi:hypothetical protein
MVADGGNDRAGNAGSIGCCSKFILFFRTLLKSAKIPHNVIYFAVAAKLGLTASPFTAMVTHGICNAEWRQ